MKISELIINKQNNYKKEKKQNKTFKIILLFIFLCLMIFFSSGLINKNRFVENKLRLNFYNFTSYSQCLEDFILYCIFYDIDKGFYIDIGANDPNKISVTKAFYLNGWHGINIEPLPEAFSDLLKYRTRDINLNYGAGLKDDNLILYSSGVGSSLNKTFARTSKTINIEIHSMSKICNKYVPKNKDIEFCKIDVEGYEKNVLLGYDFINFRPKVFCIESTLPGISIPGYNEWEYILLENGYKFGFQYAIIKIYIKWMKNLIINKFHNYDKRMNYNLYIILE